MARERVSREVGRYLGMWQPRGGAQCLGHKDQLRPPEVSVGLKNVAIRRQVACALSPSNMHPSKNRNMATRKAPVEKVSANRAGPHQDPPESRGRGPPAGGRPRATADRERTANPQKGARERLSAAGRAGQKENGVRRLECNSRRQARTSRHTAASRAQLEWPRCVTPDCLGVVERRVGARAARCRRRR